MPKSKKRRGARNSPGSQNRACHDCGSRVGLVKVACPDGHGHHLLCRARCLAVFYLGVARRDAYNERVYMGL